MEKRFIVTKNQIREYVRRRRDTQTLYEIVLKVYDSRKHLNENFSQEKFNRTVLNTYKEKGLLSESLIEQLRKLDIMAE